MEFVKSIFTVCSYRVYLHFDHHLTTTVQAAPQNVGKARCDNQQRVFSCFGGKCAEPTKFTFHRQSIPPCRSSPTRKARGSNPPGRTKSSTLWGAALFVFAWILWGSKRADSNSPCPAACVPRGRNAPVGRFYGAAWRIPSGALKNLIAMCFCNEVFLFNCM